MMILKKFKNINGNTIAYKVIFEHNTIFNKFYATLIIKYLI